MCLFYLFQWKFAFLALGRPEYLQDSDIVSSRFQVCVLFFHTLAATYVGLNIIMYFFIMRLVYISLCILILCYVTEERCVWRLGTIPGFGALWQRSQKVVCYKSGKKAIAADVFDFFISLVFMIYNVSHKYFLFWVAEPTHLREAC